MQEQRNYTSKILASGEFRQWRAALRTASRRLVVTNGCFDLLHIGHVHYLEEARALGDALLVGVNSDWAVRELKGPNRPVNDQNARAGVIAGLESVSAVFIFPELRATEFLSMAEPDIYVKGGDYTLETIPREERRSVEAKGGRIHFLNFLPGHSSSTLLDKIRSL